MVVIGDAAHPFLPYAGQGANQAIEDAASVAICLERAGRGDVPLALRVFEKLRCVFLFIFQILFILFDLPVLTFLFVVKTQAGIADSRGISRS